MVASVRQSFWGASRQCTQLEVPHSLQVASGAASRLDFPRYVLQRRQIHTQANPDILDPAVIWPFRTSFQRPGTDERFNFTYLDELHEAGLVFRAKSGTLGAIVVKLT